MNEDNSSIKDPQIWKGKASNLLSNYEERLFQFYKSGLMDKKEKVWTFWNAVFYCGTIYTTIGNIRHNLFILCKIKDIFGISSTLESSVAELHGRKFGFHSQAWLYKVCQSTILEIDKNKS